MRNRIALIGIALVVVLALVTPVRGQDPGGGTVFPPPGEWWIQGDITIYGEGGTPWVLHFGAYPTPTPIPPTATIVPTNTPRPSDTPLPPTATPIPPSITPLPSTVTPLPPSVTPTPPAIGEARELSLVADLSFDAALLPPTTRLWYDRAWYAARSDRQYPDANKAALSGDNYGVSRTLDNHIVALVEILAATGDPAALEEIYRLSQVVRGTYADTGGGYLGLVWKYCQPPDAPQCNTDYAGLDESLLFGFEARIAFILDTNRHLDPRYAEAADWWIWVGLEQHWAKWIQRKGAYDWALIYPWAAQMENTDYLTLDKSLTHAFTAVTSGWLLYGAILDNAAHLGEGERRAAVLLSMMDGTTSWTWDHRVPNYNKEPYGCQPSSYAAHTQSQMLFNYLAGAGWFAEDANMRPIARTIGNTLARADTSADTWPGTICGSGTDRLARVTINNLSGFALWDARIATDAERIYNDQQSPNTPQSLNIPAGLVLYYAVQEGVVKP